MTAGGGDATASGGSYVDAPASDGDACLFHDVMFNLLLVPCFMHD
jgi:hypothetical protein